MSNWLVALAAVLGAVIGTAGIAPIILAVARKKPIQAAAEVSLSEEARQWVQDFQEDARAARNEAATCRLEVSAAHDELRVIRREAEQVSRYLLRVLTWIDTPGMDVPRLKRLVSASAPPSGFRVASNGTGTEE